MNVKPLQMIKINIRLWMKTFQSSLDVFAYLIHIKIVPSKYIIDCFTYF